MQLVNEWEARGEVRGKTELVLALLRLKFGDCSEAFQDRIAVLPAPMLQRFGEALLQFNSIAEAESWLIVHA